MPYRNVVSVLRGVTLHNQHLQTNTTSARKKRVWELDLNFCSAREENGGGHTIFPIKLNFCFKSAATFDDDECSTQDKNVLQLVRIWLEHFNSFVQTWSRVCVLHRDTK